MNRMLLKNTEVRKRGASRQLVVILHAWTMSSVNMRDIVKAVEETMVDADLLVPDYPGRLFSNADPIKVAEELGAEIERAVTSRKQQVSKTEANSAYEEIILIGHSLGALLVRKAFVFAKGQTQDQSRVVQPKPKEWADSVSRIILMAGTNRGWTFEKKARDLSLVNWWLYRGGAFLYRWIRLGRLINSVRRGAPFVVNLRIQWLNLIRGKENLPPTIQLLGDRDDVVTEEDNVDIQSGARFIYNNVRNTGHEDVIQFDSATERREVFLYALLTPAEDLASDFYPPLEPDDTVNLVTFVMHGIRDYGHWTDDLGERIKELGGQCGTNVYPITASYGYFPMLGFLLQPERQDHVRWFTDRYTEAIAKYPNARICFVGHSNGTYLLASALRRYAAMAFDNVVFAGSVVPRNFPWDQIAYEKRISRIRNYVASQDWVVAIFPAVFEAISRYSDLGSGGHNGFLEETGREFTIEFARGGHGAAIKRDNFDAIARFILGENVPREEHEQAFLAEEQVGIFVLANKFCWFIWLVLIAVIATLCFGSAVAALSDGWHPEIIGLAQWIPWWVPPVFGPPLIYLLFRCI